MPKELRISVIVHGPEAVDGGSAMEAIRAASCLGTVTAMVGGATAAAAVIDAGLEDTISISSKELPSTAVSRAAPVSDLIILVNQGKDRESAVAFGRMVLRRANIGCTPLIQADNGSTMIWAGDDRSLSKFSSLFQGELLDLRGTTAPEEGGSRRPSGVRQGENIWINGHVIGRASRSEVVICQGPQGELVTEGIILKPTGVARLGRFDLSSAIIRSGQVRRTRGKARSIPSARISACLIDHCAEESMHRCRDAAYAVTVGDDTSKIASALLYRLGVPVIAITDGDEDGISYEELLYPGSYIFRLLPGNDDLVGAEIEREFFPDGHVTRVSLDIAQMAEAVRRACGDRLLWEKRL